MKHTFMLDSGAYSALKQGKQIALSDYVSWLRENPEYDHCVNLDIIPGAPNSPPSIVEVEESAKASYRNLQAMKDAGLHPIPVFHAGESVRWLERLIRDVEQYIGLSSDQRRSSIERELWLDRIKEVIANEPIKTHGFGLGVAEVLHAFPFTTADSTTWTFSAANGSILVPPLNEDGEPDYTVSPIRLRVMKLKHQGPRTRRIIARYVEEHCGLNLEVLEEVQESGLVGHQYWRVMQGARYYLGLEQSVRRQNSAFQFIFATWPKNSIQAKVLDQLGVRNRLHSYWELRKESRKEVGPGDRVRRSKKPGKPSNQMV